VTFCLAWTNDSFGAMPMVLWDTLPAAVTYMGCDHGCGAAGQMVTWNLGSVAAGSAGTACVWVKVTGYP
jgi:hypothetical protein